jgi:hypothetical protein
MPVGETTNLSTKTKEASANLAQFQPVSGSEYVYNLFVYYGLEHFNFEYICTVALDLSGPLKYPHTQGGNADDFALAVHVGDSDQSHNAHHEFSDR